MKADTNRPRDGLSGAGTRLLALAAVASYTALGELGYMRPGVDFEGDCILVEAPRSMMVLLLGVALLMYVWLVASVAISTQRDRWIRMAVLYAVTTAAVGTLLAHVFTHLRTRFGPSCERFLWPCVGCGEEPWYALVAPYVVPALLAGLAALPIGLAVRRVFRGPPGYLDLIGDLPPDQSSAP
jgi:hypothetical protein